MLLGMYRCTDVPGKFVWQPGSLTQAVSKGYWILLEDIDHAPLDVVGGNLQKQTISHRNVSVRTVKVYIVWVKIFLLLSYCRLVAFVVLLLHVFRYAMRELNSAELQSVSDNKQNNAFFFFH